MILLLCYKGKIQYRYASVSILDINVMGEKL